MSSIVWQTRSEILHDSFKRNELDRRANGGNAYEFEALCALRKKFNISVDSITVRTGDEKAIRYLFRMRWHRTSGDVVVRDAQVVAMSPKSRATEVAVIHHIDYEMWERSKKHAWFYRRLLSRLRSVDLIVTVSKYWAQHFQELGCRRVKTIYNAIDTRELDVTDEEVASFLDRHCMRTDRPIVYIGKPSPGKGAETVYEALRKQDYTLVMTGAKREVNLPVHYFNLSRHDYACLLRACDVIVSMSTMVEGWNRVAHEAMAVATPVVGSGTGGMRELLEGGGQIVARKDEIVNAVRRAIADKDELGARGAAFVKRFDSEYFAEAWTSVMLDMGVRPIS